MDRTLTGTTKLGHCRPGGNVNAGVHHTSQVFRIGLVDWILWHINLCRLFDAKSIFIQTISSISNNSV